MTTANQAVESTDDVNPNRRKIWLAQVRFPYTMPAIGWLILDQSESDEKPSGAPLAFIAFSEPDIDKDELNQRWHATRCYAEDPATGRLEPYMSDLRHVGRIDSRFPVPEFLYGLWLCSVNPDDPKEDDGPDHFYRPYCRLNAAIAAEQADVNGERSADHADSVDMNGVPVRVGDIGTTDDGYKVARVKHVEGEALIIELLCDESGKFVKPAERSPESWSCSQFTVLTRDATTDSSASTPSVTLDKNGRAIRVGDIVHDDTNGYLLRVVVAHSTEIIADILCDLGSSTVKVPERSWSTRANQVVYVAHAMAESVAA